MATRRQSSFVPVSSERRTSFAADVNEPLSPEWTSKASSAVKRGSSNAVGHEKSWQLERGFDDWDEDPDEHLVEDVSKMGSIKDRQAAVKLNPCRTRYNPKVRGKLNQRGASMGSMEFGATQSLKDRAVAASFSAALGASRRVKREVKIVAGTIGNVAKTAVRDMSAEGADRLQCHLIEALNKMDDDNQLEQLGVTGPSMRTELKLRHMQDIKSKCGFELRASLFEEMNTHGKWYCGAALQADLSEEKTGKNKEYHLGDNDRLDEAAITNLREKMQTESAGNDDKVVNASPEVAKAAVTARDIEECVRKTQGGGSIRRVPCDHEEVFDFADSRIYMPKWLRGDCAGQLVVVEPHIEAGGIRGQVRVLTKVPKRMCLSAAPTQIEDVMDVAELHAANTSLALQVTKESPQCKDHAHLTHCRLPPSNAAWAKWKEDNLHAKDRKQRQEAEAAGMDFEEWKRSNGKKKKVEAAEDFDSQSSDDEEEGHTTKHKGKHHGHHDATSTMGSRLSSKEPHAGSHAGSRQGSKEFAGDHFGRQHSDFGRQLSGLLPWDSRVQLTTEGLDDFLERIDFEFPEPTGIAEEALQATVGEPTAANTRTDSHSPSGSRGSPAGSKSPRGSKESGELRGRGSKESVRGSKEWTSERSRRGSNESGELRGSTLGGETTTTGRSKGGRRSVRIANRDSMEEWGLAEEAEDLGPKEQAWTLRFIDSGENPFSLDIKVPVAARGSEPAVKQVSFAQMSEDEIWQDVFQPLKHPTLKEGKSKVLGCCGC